MTPWGRAETALRLLALDPDGLGGIALHARAGPVRDAFLARLPGKPQRLHPAMGQDALEGGIDVAASLRDGMLVRTSGLLARPGTQYVLGMAERTPPLMAASLCAALDRRMGTGLIALDEHSEDEPPPPPALLDRLAFHLSLEGLALSDVEPAAAKGACDSPLAPSEVTASDAVITDLAHLAATLGITSLRAPLLALNAAKAHAALHGQPSVGEESLICAAELVLAPRATRLPEAAPPPAPEPPSEPQESATQKPSQINLPDELLLAAIETALPPDLLSKSGSDTSRSLSGSGAGKRRIGNRRGRPLPARDGQGGNAQPRVDIVATLRAAVPWQELRRQSQPSRQGPIIHPGDLRYRRYEELSDRLLVFAVDASGSAALARLAEAKGAVELLLSEAYARRDHVSLIAFRGKAAEVLLPPTRSLVQTKRRLADLPGGGGTPLAAGLSVALETALAGGRKGMSPVIILLTDGRGNVSLSGTPDREQAASDAARIALQIAQAGVESIVIDTGRRPERALRTLSASLRGRYVSLPRADAHRLSETVSAALSD